MTNDKPLLLLDIDGVLNSFGDDDGSPHHFPARLAHYSLRLDRRHPIWLKDLEQHYEIIWATMWQEDAAVKFAPLLGYGAHLPYIDFDIHLPRLTGGVGGYKLPGVKATVKDRPCLWIDDDGYTNSIQSWAKKRNRIIPTKIVSPDPKHGMTKIEYRQMLSFAANLKESHV